MRARRARLATISALALGILLGSVPSAQADHHFMSVREVYAGSGAQPNSEFVELQMYAAGQNAVNNEAVITHSALDDTNTNYTFVADVGNGANQATILLATGEAVTEFGLTGASAPDRILTSNTINPAGGAVCFDDAEPGFIDCVAWGSFPNSVALGAGPVEDPIPSGSSITRSISANCATGLDAADDTNSSAADFVPAAPTPRANALAPVDFPCMLPVIPATPNNPAAPTNPTSKQTKKKKCKKAKKRSATAAKKCKKRK